MARSLTLGSQYAGRTICPSLYATAQFLATAFAGEFARVLGQDVAGHEAASEMLIACPDGIARWFGRDELALCL
jgi:hypothetical protein